MLSGRAPFHAQSRDDSAAAVMARIKGGEFDFNADAWNHVSAQAKYVTKGKASNMCVLKSKVNRSIGNFLLVFAICTYS